ncbi:MAG TPA: hypothetical protein H9730_13135, partial [Candidatus Mediterraneibacter stercoripullorum]|nr:hypothetical protein [Candidatus Mediterraneibacter stercoripullorum]
RGLAVYLPYGYDADRAEPYKILYLSHGASGDQTGNELRWMNEGAVANIMDNLAAEGKIEPYVVVTMNNQDLGWDFDKIWAEQELIMNLIEDKYNVSDSADGRAFAGLSMGGFTTSNMYMNHPEDFSYFGIWSYANVEGMTDEVKDKLSSMKDKPHLFLAAGEWDYLLGPVSEYSDILTDMGIDHDYLQVPGAHDWETWQLIYAYAAENFFWKADTTDPGDVPPATDKPGTSDPDKGNGNSGGNSSAINTGSKSPGKVNTNSPAAKTGDDLNAGFAAGSAIVSLVLLTAVIIIRKKYFSAR